MALVGLCLLTQKPWRVLALFCECFTLKNLEKLGFALSKISKCCQSIQKYTKGKSKPNEPQEKTEECTRASFVNENQ